MTDASLTDASLTDPSLTDTQDRRVRRRRRQHEHTEGHRRLAFLDHAMADYVALLTATLILLGFGLVMVYSASSVESLAADGSTFGQFAKQFLFALIGVPAMLWLSRRPVSFFERYGPPSLAVAIVLLVLVLIPGIGIDVGGQQNWIGLPGGFNLQPSEFTKLAFILWSARLLTLRQDRLTDWKEVLLPFLPVAGGIVLLILLEGDVGTALVFMPIIAMMLFMVGVPMRLFGLIGGLLVGVIALMSLTEGYRMQRFATWLDPEADPTGAGWQVIHGKMALATGGWWGVGLGGSREKWGALPEAHNDFIFAVIGEELGFFGTLFVLFLFGVIGLVAIRIARRTDSVFVRLATMGIVAWIFTQTLINIGAVIGVLPVTGVPLPLVSYGGSSLVLVLAAIGVLLSFARCEPAAAAYTKQRRISNRRQRRQARRPAAQPRAASPRAAADAAGMGD